MLNRDYAEILSIFIEKKVEFLIVGAYALAAYGFPRSTGDIDIFVNPTAENSVKVYESLKDFGAPLAHLDETSFSVQGVVNQIGVAPVRIDIITSIDGVDFNKAHNEAVWKSFSGLNLPFISKENLIINKRATGRKKDELDAETLENSMDKKG